MREKRLHLFPISTKIIDDHLNIGGKDVISLADHYGTPLYIYDLAEMDEAALKYREALKQNWAGSWSITYAGKAFLCKRIARWASGQQFRVDCTGAGEISIAVNAGLTKDQIVVHGVNKSIEDIQAALKWAGILIVDNISELNKIYQLSKSSELPGIWLRYQPGSSVDTHAYTQTGHSSSKFGMNREQILEANLFCRLNNIRVTGLHFHQGSQFRDAEPLGDGINGALDLAMEIGFENEWNLSPGGGWGISYNEDELPDPPVEKYVQFITTNVRDGCAKRGLSLPVLHLEPGRSLIARAGAAIYRVGTVKQSGKKKWLLVDGGLADNPRPALYGARYSCLPVEKPLAADKDVVTIGGPYCESGDVLIEGISLPEIDENELIAIPVSGAYQISMSSNYNGARRPAVILVNDGKVEIIQKRETITDLAARYP